MKQIVCSLLLLLLPLAAQGEIYKWVDEKGKVHFTDSKEEARRKGSQAKKIDVKVQTIKRDKTAQGYDLYMQEQRDKKREEEKARREAAEKARKEERRKRDCQRLAAELEMLQNVNAVFSSNEAGERDFISHQEKVSRQQRLQEFYDEHCTE